MTRVKRQFTKFAIDARKTAGLTQLEAADFLGCSVNTLQKYEADDIRMHDDIAARMAMVYHDPMLARMYCENECAIGCQESRCECDRSLEGLLLDVALLDKADVDNLVKVARRITDDGVIDDSELDDCAQCIAALDKLEKKLGSIKLHLQRMCATSGH